MQLNTAHDGERWSWFIFQRIMLTLFDYKICEGKTSLLQPIRHVWTFVCAYHVHVRSYMYTYGRHEEMWHVPSYTERWCQLGQSSMFGLSNPVGQLWWLPKTNWYHIYPIFIWTILCFESLSAMLLKVKPVEMLI